MVEGLKEDSNVHPSFDSLEGITHFIRGVGDYSDRNSFFLTEEDHEMQRTEGYFARPYCGRCVEDFMDEIVTADPLEADLEPDVELDVFEREEEVNSFRPGYDRFVEEIKYMCRDHPEVSISQRDSWYEEK